VEESIFSLSKLSKFPRCVHNLSASLTSFRSQMRSDCERVNMSGGPGMKGECKGKGKE
jgi:hypothetical protein